MGAAVGDALAVASGILAGVASSGEAAGSIVAPAGAGAAFGFAGAGVGGKPPTFSTTDPTTFKRAVDMTDDELAAIASRANLTVIK